MPDGIDMSTAMKLIHSSNARKQESREDPRFKEILPILKEIEKQQEMLVEAVEKGDNDKVDKLQESIDSMKGDLNLQGVSDNVIEMGFKKYKDEWLGDMLKNIQEDVGKMSDDTIAELVRMMKTGKTDDSVQLDKESMEGIELLLVSTMHKSGVTDRKSMREMLKYLQTINSDVAVSNDTIKEMVEMNKNLNNHLVTIGKDNETNAYMIADKLAGLSDKELQMLTQMEELPSHTVEAINIEERRRKLKDNPFGSKLLAIEESFGKFGKKWEKWGSAMKDPIGFIKPMFTTIGKMFSLIWKTIIPTMVSMAVSLFTVVLPTALMILAVVILALLAVYVIWKIFGSFIKKVLWGAIQVIWEIVKTVAGVIWDYLPVVWAAVKVIWNIVSGVFKFVNALFSGDWAGIGKIIMEIASSVWNLLMKFGEFIFKHPILGTVVGILTYLGAKMTALAVWQKAKDAWDFLFRRKIEVAEGVNKAGWIQAKAFQMWAKVMEAKKWIVETAFRAWNFVTSGAILTSTASILLGILPIAIIALSVAAIVGFVWYFRKEIWGFLEPIFSWFADVFMIAWEFYSGMFKKVWEWITSFWSILWSGLKETVAGVVANIGKALNPFNWFAEGGEVSKPVPGIVGEAGPEAIIPLSGSGESKLSKALIEFFDYYLPFFKPLVNFLWDNFKPYMPILQSVLDAIYSVVYSIISGLAKLPGWLGGEFFASMLSRLTPPKAGGGALGGSKDDSQLLMSLISGEIGDKPVLSVVGKNRVEVASFDGSKRPMTQSTFGELGRFVSNTSNSMEAPKYAQDIQKGIQEIGDGIETLVGKMSRMEKNIIDAVGQGGKTVTQDKQFELSKLMSRNSFNGGRV